MDRESVRQALQEVFRTVFSDPKLELFDEMTAKDVKAWDSLNHINLIVAVEERFRLRLTTKEVAGLKNVGGLIALLQGKLG